MSAIGRRGPDGFTLIEMLVVLAILGLIGGLVYPALQRAIRSQELRSAGAAALSALRAARANALVSGARVRVGVGAGGAVLAMDRAAPEPLPPSIRASTDPRAGIAFFADGSSSGGTLSVAGAAGSIRLVVAPVTGLVRSVPG